MDAAAKRRARLAKWNSQAKPANPGSQVPESVQSSTPATASKPNSQLKPEPVVSRVKLDLKPVSQGVKKLVKRPLIWADSKPAAEVSAPTELSAVPFTDDLLSDFLTRLEDDPKIVQSSKATGFEALEAELLDQPEDSHETEDLRPSSFHKPEAASALTNWAEIGLPLSVVHALRNSKFETLTPVQAHAVPYLLLNQDLIAVAPTGSGKTLAYSLPLIKSVLSKPRTGKPLALIVTPTRELCHQIALVVDQYAAICGLTTLELSGGGDMKQQIASVKRGVDIIVSTPGRLLDVAGTATKARALSLQLCQLLILDEADRMLDLGFGPQINSICTLLPPDHTTALFTATFPKFLRNLAFAITKDSAFVQIKNKSKIPETIDQKIEVVEIDKKHSRLQEIISSVPGPTLVFCETQNDVDKLNCFLLDNSVLARALHGGLSQLDRDDAIKEFKSGKAKVLVASSLAARGLDISGLETVINFDPPSHSEDYIHRAGRTGRAGKSGTVITFLSPLQTKQASVVFNIAPSSISPEMLAQPPFDQMSSNEKQRSGFGGHGLEHMDEKSRQYNTALKQIIMADPSDEKKQPGNDRLGNDAKKNMHKRYNEVEVTELLVRGQRVYQAIVPINNHHLQVRSAATSAANLSKIMESCNVAITGKGEYRAPDQPFTKSTDGLHILIEGSSSECVHNAYAMIIEVIEAKQSDVALLKGKY